MFRLERAYMPISGLTGPVISQFSARCQIPARLKINLRSAYELTSGRTGRLISLPLTRPVELKVRSGTGLKMNSKFHFGPIFIPLVVIKYLMLFF